MKINKILYKILSFSWKMIHIPKWKFRGVTIDWEELDDKEIAASSARSARETIVLQQDAGVGFAVLLNNVAWLSKMPH
jgi:hypothetical protein